MLQKQTVFVLGAGASVPFGLPTGLELSQRILESTAQGGYGRDLLDEFGFKPEDIDRFRDAFRLSARNSIDAFLEHRREFIDIGKTALACVLITYEREEKLFDAEGNWLRYMFNATNAGFAQFVSQPLNFITFNYDRSVEHFLSTALKNSFACSDEQIDNAFRKIRVLHLHGRLAYLPWQAQIKQDRPYSPDVEYKSVERAAKHIKIIHEIDDDFAMAKRLLATAEQVFFLGFGFHPTNVDRLSIRSLPAGKAKATAIGLTERERLDIERRSGGSVSLYEVDCLTMLRNHVDWD
jgi:hypothetical protein